MVLSNIPIPHRIPYRIDTIPGRIRQDAARYLDRKFVEQAYREIGHRWRNRVLNPSDALHWFFLRISLGNTAVEYLALLANRVFTGAACCQDRALLPRAFFQTVLSLTPITQQEECWRGHRTLLIDGSGVSMPETPGLQNHFGRPSKSGAETRLPRGQGPGAVPRRSWYINIYV